MAITSHLRAAWSALLAAALLGTIGGGSAHLLLSAPDRTTATSPSDDPDLDGRDLREPATHRPTVEAAFPKESYAPGDVARLAIYTSGVNVVAQIFRAGTETSRIEAHD